MKEQIVHIAGAGLAGSEAAWQLALRGVLVMIHEMKPHKFSPAHKNPAAPNWSVPIRCVRTIMNIMPSG